MEAQTFQKKKQVEMMVLVDMRIVREEFRNVGKMTLKRIETQEEG